MQNLGLKTTISKKMQWQFEKIEDLCIISFVGNLQLSVDSKFFRNLDCLAENCNYELSLSDLLTQDVG